MNDEFRNRFAYHKPKDQDTVDLHQSIREDAYRLASIIENDVPDGRAKHLAITQIEEAMYWANAAIARNPDATAEGRY